jgi:hypothetical protein
MTTKSAPAKPVSPMKRYYLFFIILAIFSTAVILTNMSLRRGPAHDVIAVNDINTLQSAVDNYYLRTKELPDNLSQIDLSGSKTAMRVRDYEYNRLSATTYQLLADFQTSHTADYPAPVYQSGNEVPDPNNHGKGRQCFTYNIIPIESGRPFER